MPWILCAFPGPASEGTQIEKYLAPTCLKVRQERLTATRDIGVKNFRGAGYESWEWFRYFVLFQALSDWLGLIDFFSHTLHNN